MALSDARLVRRGADDVWLDFNSLYFLLIVYRQELDAYSMEDVEMKANYPNYE